MPLGAASPSLSREKGLVGLLSCFFHALHQLNEWIFLQTFAVCCALYFLVLLVYTRDVGHHPVFLYGESIMIQGHKLDTRVSQSGLPFGGD